VQPLAKRGARRYMGVSERKRVAMRAEIQKIVDDIKQSVGLLRRHL
jgi:hypothetical protein